jgi:hypothetical protein
LTYLAWIKKGGGKYCSKKCFTESHCGENAPNWKGGRRKCKCLKCGKDFFARAWDIKNSGGGKYCSRKCSSDSRRNKIKRICKICNKEFFIWPSDDRGNKRKYCSVECANKGQSGKNSPRWNGGTSFLPYCPKFNERRKKAVRNFFNNTCLACGKHTSENIIGGKVVALSVHHSDHDKEQGCSGKPFNLVPLCHDCHGDERFNQEEYHKYINKTLEEGFKWGIWNREEYMEKVMYPGD